MTDEPLKSGARGGMITGGGQILKILLQLVGLVILARLLSPDDFGLVAMVMVFVTLGELLRDFGLSTAALQARTLTRQQSANMFWANSALGVLLAVILVVCIPFIVRLYDEPRLVSVTAALALVVVLNGIQAQVQVQLARKLRFTTLTLTDLVAQLVALVAAIIGAVFGLEYWALILQQVLASGLMLGLRFMALREAPGLPRRESGTRALFVNSAHLGAAQLLGWGASNADTVVIGATSGATALGFYNRAFQLLTAPISRLLGPLTQVAVPGINSATQSGHRAEPLLLRVQSTLGLLLIWVFVVASTSAPILIPIAMGDKWTPAVLLFQILAVGGCFNVLSYVSYWGFLLGQASKELLFYNLVSKPLTVIFIIVGGFYGVEGVAAGYALGLLINWPLNLWWLHRRLGMNMRPFVSNGVRYLLAGAGGLLSGALLSPVMGEMQELVRLFVLVVATTLVYGGLIACSRRGRSEILGLVQMIRKLV